MARTCMYHCAMLRPSTLQHLMWLQALTGLTHCGMQAEQLKHKSHLIWAAFGLLHPMPLLPVIRLNFPRRFTPHGTRSAAWLAHTHLQDQSVPHHSHSLTLPLNVPCAEWGTGLSGAWRVLHCRLLLCKGNHANGSTSRCYTDAQDACKGSTAHQHLGRIHISLSSSQRRPAPGACSLLCSSSVWPQIGSPPTARRVLSSQTCRAGPVPAQPLLLAATQMTSQGRGSCLWERVSRVFKTYNRASAWDQSARLPAIGHCMMGGRNPVTCMESSSLISWDLVHTAGCHLICLAVSNRVQPSGKSRVVLGCHCLVGQEKNVP
jgi:hypothetical protein